MLVFAASAGAWSSHRSFKVGKCCGTLIYDTFGMVPTYLSTLPFTFTEEDLAKYIVPSQSYLACTSELAHALWSCLYNTVTQIIIHIYFLFCLDIRGSTFAHDLDD